jgi:transposase-like protein/G:T-mismatch repair DNA endonuclease (very short patch repair protein)
MILPDKNELEQKYSAFGTTLSSLAKEYGVSQPTVRKWMIKYDIERKPHQQASSERNKLVHDVTMPSKQYFESALQIKPLSLLSRELNVGLAKLREWITHHNIVIDFRKRCVEGKSRQFAEMHAITTEEFLRLYHSAGSLAAMSDITGRDRAWLNRKRKELNIDLLAVKCSSHEKKIQRLLESNKIVCIANDRSIIAPKELDIVIPSQNLAIEVCGTMWHSEHFGNKTKNYHRDKMKAANIAGHHLITLWDFEVDLPKTKTMLLSLTNKLPTIGARQCKLKKIVYKDVKDFENKYHMMGTRPATVYIGLYYKDKLVSTMSFGKSRYSSSFEWEMIRYCNGDIKIAGGASKLFTYFKKNYLPDSVITYSDLRFGEGNVYNHLGFERQNNTSPNYFYFHKTNPSKLFSRVKFQKHKLKEKLDIFDPNLTEIQNMVNNGYQRVWDCGNAVWTINTRHIR